MRRISPATMSCSVIASPPKTGAASSCRQKSSRRTTRRGTVELVARQDDAIPDGVVFMPFAFVEAAANLLTNPALDPFGKIPEFKYCAAKVEPVTEATPVAAE